MKAHSTAFVGIGIVLLFAAALASVFQIRLAIAQEDASSSPPLSTDATSTPLVDTSTSTPPLQSASVSADQTAPAEATTSTATTSQAAALDTATHITPLEPSPVGLTEVHIVGTKYIDYFTDGSTTIAVPGDPIIDGHLSDPGVPLPTHEGMTWVHTTGSSLYDTPSGDLELGDYALQPSGYYAENAPPFVSSTSTSSQITTSTTSDTATDTSSSTATLSDSSSGTTISPKPTTSPGI